MRPVDGWSFEEERFGKLSDQSEKTGNTDQYIVQGSGPWISWVLGQTRYGLFHVHRFVLGGENVEKLFYMGPTPNSRRHQEGFLTIDMMRLGSMKGTISVTSQGGSDVVDV